MAMSRRGTVAVEIFRLYRNARSRTIFGSHEDGPQIEPVCIGIVAVEFRDFRNEPASRPAFKVNEHVQRIANIGADGGVRNVYPAKQNAAREPREALLGRIRMNG